MVVSKRAVARFRRARRTTKRDRMWYVYIIQCADDTLYTGTTTDIPRRVKEHNSKKGGSYTRTRVPVKLVYKEPQTTHSSALKREEQIKRWTKSKKLALINGNLAELSRLSISRD
ncbi:MAG: GIY-YIG nuclease family protein [Candidatus Omnitrophota bacterium]